MKEEELSLITNEIIPPMHGGIKYAAKVRALYIEKNGKREKVNHEFGETWGVTPEEAKAKMTAFVRKWLSEQV